MNWFIDKIAWVMDKFGKKVPKADIPWDKLDSFMNTLTPYLADANILFPVDDILAMLIILMAIRAVLLAIWVIKFIRGLLPF